MARTAQGTITIMGCEIPITNPDKPLWPEAGITKAIYLEKLALLAPYLLKYCRNRLLTVIRWPHGIHGKFFYQKNAPVPRPEYISTYRDGDIEYIVLNELPQLLWLGNQAALEFHPSLHDVGSILPREWIIDLDPTLEIEPRIMEAASLVDDVLRSLGIASVAKTSGATGVQIIVPIHQGITFDELRSVGHLVGRYVTEKHPKLFTIERLKKIAVPASTLIICSITLARRSQPLHTASSRWSYGIHPAHMGRGKTECLSTGLSSA